MKINIKALVSYLFMIAISVLFMLFLDGPGGSYLLISLLAGLIVSFSVFIWSKNTVSAHIQLSEDILNKGDIVKVNVELRKKGFLPTAFIRFAFSSSIHFITNEHDSYSVVIFAMDSHRVEKIYKAVFFGNGNVGVSDMVISDYLGIFSYSVNNLALLNTIKIYPDIPEVSGRDNFARSLTDAVSFDDSEETTQSTSSINGVPGYDYRKYVPGDNLKLINWKVSAKRGELLVRQLEGTGGAEQTFVLVRDDLYFEESQYAAEAMLGMIKIFARAELPIKVVIYIDDSWEELSVQNASDLAQLRYKMTDYYIFPLKKYCADNNCTSAPELRKTTIPDSFEGDRVVIFAPVYDENLALYVNTLSEQGKEYEVAACECPVAGNHVRKIQRDNLSICFTD